MIQEIPSCNPNAFKIDFEISTINVTFLPMLHSRDSIFILISISLEKSTVAWACKIIYLHLQMLTHLPPYATDMDWLNITEKSPQVGAVEAFNDYFVEHW